MSKTQLYIFPIFLILILQNSIVYSQIPFGTDLGCSITNVGDVYYDRQFQPIQPSPPLTGECALLNPEYNTLSCCDNEFALFINSSLSSLASFFTDPICFNAVAQFKCSICSPYQANFMIVDGNSTDIESVEFYIEPSYAQSFYNLCKNTGNPRIGSIYPNYASFLEAFRGIYNQFLQSFTFANDGYTNTSIIPTPTPSQTPTQTPTQNPTSQPTPAPPANTPPTVIYGIFQDNFGNYNISSYSIVTGVITNYPISQLYGNIYGIVSINETYVTFISGDDVSISIFEMELETSYSSYIQTMIFNQPSDMYILPGTYAYNQDTGILYATGYLQNFEYSNITIFQFDFVNEKINNIFVSDNGLASGHTTSAFYDQPSGLYYVNVFDTAQNSDIVYAFNTSAPSSGKSSFAYQLDVQGENEILFILTTSNGQLYGVSNDDNGFLMVYTVNGISGEVDLFFHIKNSIITTLYPVIGYNNYLVIISDSNGGVNGNQVTLLNTLNRQTKTFPIGNEGFLPNGGFFLGGSF